MYRGAQLDDHFGLARSHFPWHPPFTLDLRARVSTPDWPGTWGFGVWNDPFSASLGLGGMHNRLPTFPDAAWFFFASPPNYLSFRDDLPAQGFLAATFRSSRLPTPLFALGAPALPLLAWRPFARLARRLASRFIRQDSACLDTDPTLWHTYTVDWRSHLVRFFIDQQQVFETPVSPHGPLGLVLWIDNQFAAFTPQGSLSLGTLSTPQTGWLELDAIRYS